MGAGASAGLAAATAAATPEERRQPSHLLGGFSQGVQFGSVTGHELGAILQTGSLYSYEFDFLPDRQDSGPMAVTQANG